MVTNEVAHKLVTEAVCGVFYWLAEGDEIIILEGNTIEKPWGWVIFHTSRLWLETNDIKYAIAGNAPTIVERETGKLIPTGTAMSIEQYIEKLRKNWQSAHLTSGSNRSHRLLGRTKARSLTKGYVYQPLPCSSPASGVR